MLEEEGFCGVSTGVTVVPWEGVPVVTARVTADKTAAMSWLSWSGVMLTVGDGGSEATEDADSRSDPESDAIAKLVRV